MDTSTRNWSRLTVPNDLAFLPTVLDFVRDFAGLVGLPDADARRVELAAEETAAVVEEGAPGASPQPMDVEPAGAPAPTREELSVRWMLPDEAVQVSRCVYDSHGHSYANEHLYYPDRVRALNQSGDLRSAVAVTAAGEIGGHIALIFDLTGRKTGPRAPGGGLAQGPCDVGASSGGR